MACTSIRAGAAYCKSNILGGLSIDSVNKFRLTVLHVRKLDYRQNIMQNKVIMHVRG